MVDVEIRAPHVAALVRAVNNAADPKAIRSELYKALNSASKPVREEMKKSTADPVNLPTSGGLQGLMVAKQSVVASIRGGPYAGVRIKVASKKGAPDLGAIYRTGRVVHPVFGRGRRYPQTAGIKPRWMDPVFEAQKPVVQAAIQEALEYIAGRVTNS